MKLMSKMPFLLALIGVATGIGLAEEDVLICKIVMCVSFLLWVILYSLMISYKDIK